MKVKKTKNFLFQGGPRGVIIFALVFLALLTILNRLNQYTQQVHSLTFTQFVQKVEADQIKSALVSGQEVSGKLSDGSSYETVVPDGYSQWDLLKSHNVEVAIESGSGQYSFWIFVVIGIGLLLLLGLWYLIHQLRSNNSGNNIFPFVKSRARMFMPSTIKENFDSVAGVAEAKEELKDIIDFLRNPSKYRRLGAKITRGVLLVGEPGNGKTMLAKAVAGEANCPFFSISGSDFIEVFVGVGASRVRDLFAQARRYSPSIVFIDELDAVGRQRGAGLGGGHDEREQTLNQLLTEMDGFQTKEGSVIVLAATNRPDVLDKALLRPGRFDRRVVVTYPDLASREQILRVHSKSVQMDPAIDLSIIARGTPGFSGADLANLVNEAAINASKNNQDFVRMADFETARDKIILGKEIKSIVRTKEELRMTAYHESGHALLTILQPEESDPLHKVTIMPRGSSLGVSYSFPDRDKYTTTKNEMLADIVVFMGGRAAEELVFNTVSTGAAHDFKVASNVARNLVCRYGMSDLGKVVYSQENGEFVYSQRTAELIDQEVNKIIDANYKKAVALLTEHRAQLDLLAEKLLEKETMYASEIYELLGMPPRQELRFT